MFRLEPGHSLTVKGVDDEPLTFIKPEDQALTFFGADDASIDPSTASPPSWSLL